MGQSRFMFPRTADGTLDRVFREVATPESTANDGSVDIIGVGSVGCGFKNAPSEPWRRAVEANGYLAQTLSMTVGTLSVTFYRGGIDNPKSPFLDELMVSWPDQADARPPALERLQIVQTLQRRLTSVDPINFVGIGITPEQNQLAAIHNGILSRLEETATRSMELIDLRRKELDDKYEKKVADLERELADRKKSLDEQAAERQEKLHARERDFEDRLKAIDARDNTVVRREIRDRMLKDVTDRVSHFGVSASTAAKRAPVHWTILALIVISLLFAVSALVEILGTRAPGLSDTLMYLLYGRLSAGAVGAVAGILYYAKWANSWAQTHAQAEFQLQQFQLDVNRASWVIESCLEWQKEAGSTAIPAELLASMTRNLFQESKQPDQVLHPADELASAILGSAAHLKLRTDGAEIDINNPGKKLPARLAAKATSC
jgi:hypothetical protein